MFSKKKLYLSRILGSKARTEVDSGLGKVKDFLVDVSRPKPYIIAVLVGRRGKNRLLDFTRCSIHRVVRKYHVMVREETEAQIPAENVLYLKKHILDKQIVDVDGRKLVRVNDLVLDMNATGTFLAAVDVGLEGILRRLGLAKIVSVALRGFKKEIPSKLILWSDVEAVDFPSMEIKLSKAYQKLATFHPSDLADILEDLDRSSQIAIFNAMDEERAADVLEELEPGAQVNLIENLSLERAADVLEKMPADEAADILDDLNKERVEELLNEMENEVSQEVRTLLEYPENAVGSFMTRDYIAFGEGLIVEQILEILRMKKPETEEMYYLYVLDDEGKYRATVSLRDIVLSKPETKLSSIMSEEVLPILDTDDIFSIAQLLLKYKLHAVPVVDAGGLMAGVIIIEDVLDLILHARKMRWGVRK